MEEGACFATWSSWSVPCCLLCRLRRLVVQLHSEVRTFKIVRSPNSASTRTRTPIPRVWWTSSAPSESHSRTRRCLQSSHLHLAKRSRRLCVWRGTGSQHSLPTCARYRPTAVDIQDTSGVADEPCERQGRSAIRRLGIPSLPVGPGQRTFHRPPAQRTCLHGLWLWRRRKPRKRHPARRGPCRLPRQGRHRMGIGVPVSADREARGPQHDARLGAVLHVA